MNQFPTEEEPLDVTEVRKVKRITIAQVFRSAIDAFNVDRGGIYTVKSLFVNPGRAIKDYLGANRYHYTPPFRILIVSTALALFAIGVAEFTQVAEAEFTAGVSDSVNEANKEKVDVTAEVTKLLQELSAYFNLLLWTFIPFIALFTWLINLKKRFNYAEHLVFQTYLACISNIFGFLFPLDHLLPAWLVFSAVYAGVLFYYVYGYKEFLGKSWLRSIFESVFLFLISSVLWSVILGLLFGILIAYRLNS